MRPSPLFWSLLVVAAALRIPGMFHDFWFDEAWSLLLVREHVATPFDVLTRLHVDNNHPLNSWMLYAIGDRAPWALYRLPSLVLGVGTVVLAGQIMWRRGRPHAMAAMIFVTSSYPLILYSSEARGYAPLAFFVLLAIDAAERDVAAPAVRSLITFWAAVALGFLAHLTFLHAYLAILLWSAFEVWRRTRDFRGAAERLARLHTVPLLFLTALYLVFARHVVVAGGAPAPLTSVLAETVGVTLGLPSGGPWSSLSLLLLLPIAVTIATMFRRAPGPGLLFAAGIFAIPALAVIIEHRGALIPPRFFPRYFLVSTTLTLLLAAWAVGELRQRGKMARAAAALVVGLFVAGSLWQVAEFARGGRGRYREAVMAMAREAEGSEIRVTSNSDFRTGVLLAVYQRYLPQGRTLVLLPQGSARAAEAEWHIVEDLAPNSAVPDEIADSSGHRYRLKARFGFSGLSGCQWALYQRVKPTIRAVELTSEP